MSKLSELKPLTVRMLKPLTVRKLSEEVKSPQKKQTSEGRYPGSSYAKGQRLCICGAHLFFLAKGQRYPFSSAKLFFFHLHLE